MIAAKARSNFLAIFFLLIRVSSMPKNIRNDKKAPREPKKHFNQKNEGIC